MSKQRYVIEGTWSGYTSSQSRTVHREVTDWPKLAEWVGKAGGISYTDGTMLWLSVREARPRERVKQILGYRSLIRDCYYAGVSSVAALPRKSA